MTILAMGLLTAPAIAQERAQAGVAAGVRGEVLLASAEAPIGRRVETREPIFLGDRITTGPGARLQVMLLDETTFTLGPSTEMTIDTYVYDPSGAGNRLQARFTKGVMRFVTGQITASNPQAMEIATPTAVLGVRGTVGLLETMTPERAAERFPDSAAALGKQETVLGAYLLGPDLNQDSGNRRGAFDVVQGDTVRELRRGGSGVLVGAEALSDPFRLPPGTVDRVLAGIQGAGGPTPAGQDQGQDGSGAVPRDGGGSVGSNEVLQTAEIGIGQGLAARVEVAAVEQAAEIATEQSVSAEQTTTIALGITPTTVGQLRTVSGGVVTFQSTGVPLSGPGGATGSYNFSIGIDFGNRVFQPGGFTAINVSGPFTVTNGSISFGVTQPNYAGDPDFELVKKEPDAGDVINNGGCSSCVFDYSAQVFNINGVIAAGGQHKLKITEGAHFAEGGASTF